MNANMQQIKQAQVRIQDVLCNGRILIRGNALTGVEINQVVSDVKMLGELAEVLTQTRLDAMEATKKTEAKKE